MNPDALVARLAAAGVRVERDVSVADLTTYHVGGPVAVLVRVGTPPSSARSPAALAGDVPPLLLIGRGSNLLVADAGFPGLGLVLDGEFETLTSRPMPTRGPTTVRAGAAVALPVLARRAAAAGRTGLEFYVGIPGSVGGAVRMNAGGHGRETADVLVEAGVVDLAGERRAGGPQPAPRSASATGARRSGPAEVVTGATFRVVAGDAGRGRGRGRRDRALAPGAPARRRQRGLGVRQPARRLGRAPHRRPRAQGPAGRRRGGVAEARQLLPGRGRGDRRRRARGWWSRCAAGCSTPPGSRWSPSCA